MDRQPMNCAACRTAQQNAKAAGHRDWREGVCFNHAAVDLRAHFGEPIPDQGELFEDPAR